MHTHVRVCVNAGMRMSEDNIRCLPGLPPCWRHALCCFSLHTGRGSPSLPPSSLEECWGSGCTPLPWLCVALRLMLSSQAVPRASFQPLCRLIMGKEGGEREETQTWMDRKSNKIKKRNVGTWLLCHGHGHCWCLLNNYRPRPSSLHIWPSIGPLVVYFSQLRKQLSWPATLCVLSECAVNNKWFR